ncbi:4-hydroxybutyrate CoA-transferase [Subtercola boreus]|uniref:4-hydroxybutyrate CoA-transferase n=1 Tax=Subtercola boreus TaxID=120213 RepID=A0A3E0VLA7_9MICO|nr:acetyl-CoA hydrolase/transferase C-terminal domain-containing protein [Subtercola boreus]RFA10501.1 4-hydroxybutyrate CoA-transferase [Subtercola boreus]TQL55962.1 acyl-CoA hydrolase [Subtercola boreus]
MIDLTGLIHAGDEIWWSQTSAEPTPLVHALLDQLHDIGPVTAFVGLTFDKRITRNPPPELSIVSYGALGDLRHLSKEGRLEVVPANYSGLPDLFARGELPGDVALVQVSPPDENGICSLGVGVDYAADAIEHTRVIIAEINERMPVTSGSAGIHVSRFAASIRTDRPLLEAPLTVSTPVDLAIAGHIAGLIEDGDTIQLGVGALPAAVLADLRGHRELGVHSGLITDGIADLVDRGVITGARKEIDTGVIVTGAALGSTAFYERLDDLPVRFCAASYTHSARTLSHLRSLVSINSAIEVDLSGQVNAEMRRGTYIGAVGGQSDFSRAASASGARSIIAVRSTGGSHSTIVPTVDTVTTSRTDVDVVVTEHGAAHLRGCGFAERARRLIEVAAPEHRESLERAAGRLAAMTA